MTASEHISCPALVPAHESLKRLALRMAGRSIPPWGHTRVLGLREPFKGKPVLLPVWQAEIRYSRLIRLHLAGLSDDLSPVIPALSMLVAADGSVVPADKAEGVDVLLVPTGLPPCRRSCDISGFRLTSASARGLGMLFRSGRAGAGGISLECIDSRKAERFGELMVQSGFFSGFSREGCFCILKPEQAIRRTMSLLVSHVCPGDILWAPDEYMLAFLEGVFHLSPRTLRRWTIGYRMPEKTACACAGILSRLGITPGLQLRGMQSAVSVPLAGVRELQRRLELVRKPFGDWPEGPVRKQVNRAVRVTKVEAAGNGRRPVILLDGFEILPCGLPVRTIYSAIRAPK